MGSCWASMDSGCHHLRVRKVSIMGIGVVKWFNAEKGYGFIAPDDRTADPLVHVQFETQAGNKGPQAVQVHIAEGS